MKSSSTQAAMYARMWGDNSFGRTPPVKAAVAESQTVAAAAADDSQLQMITKLTERNKTQGHLLRAWKQRLREQNELIFRLHKEREEQMRLLTSQLLLFEANLRSKQTKIDSLLEQRDRTINNQQDTIRTLEREVERLKIISMSDTAAAAHRPQTLPLVIRGDREVKIDCITTHRSICQTTRDQSSPPLMRLLGRDGGDESLDDGDSAVVIEDDHHRHSPTFSHHKLTLQQQDEQQQQQHQQQHYKQICHSGRHSQVRVIRSISDVVASARANVCIDRSQSLTLRLDQADVAEETREEEEDDDEDIGEGSGSSSSDDSPFNKRGHKSFLRDSFERMPIQQQRDSSTGNSGAHHRTTITTGGGGGITIGRCGSSNHRNVTRPRDVKSKKFNKIRASTSAGGGRVSPCLISSPVSANSSSSSSAMVVATGFHLSTLSSPV